MQSHLRHSASLGVTRLPLYFALFGHFPSYSPNLTDGTETWRIGARDGELVWDYELTELGFKGIEDTDWYNAESVVNWGSHWAVLGLTDYVQRTKEEGGFVKNKEALKDAVQDAIDIDIFDKIVLWTNPLFGSASPLTLPLTPTVVFTMDDGVLTEYTNIFPAFQTRGITGTSFITTDYIETGRSPETYGPNMTWAQLAILDAAGWDTQCHSHTHPSFLTINKSEMEDEMSNVDAAFTAHNLPLPIHHAYPGGINDPASWKVISRAKRRLKRLVFTEGYRNKLSGLALNRLRSSNGDIDDATKRETAKGYIDEIKLLNQTIVFYMHGSTAIALPYFLAVVDYAIAQGVDVLNIKDFNIKMNKIRGKYFSVKDDDFFLNDLFEYTPVVSKRLYFNDTLANITVPVADAYVADGYEVGFLDDTADAAHAYIVGNASFRNIIRTTVTANSGLSFISIGTGAKIDVTEHYISTYYNGYGCRLMTTRRCKLFKYVAGVETELADVTPAAGVINAWTVAHTFAIVLNSGQVEVWVNGTKIIDVADATYSSGNIMISSGTYTTKNSIRKEITSFADSGGLIDTFTDPDVSELNYTQWNRYCRDGDITFNTGLLIIEAIGGSGTVHGGSIGIERIGAFTSVTLAQKDVYPVVDNLRKMIEWYPSLTVSNEYFDFNGKAIAGELSTCGIHLLKNTPEIRLYTNALTGTIPVEWKELFYLKILRLDSNQISTYEAGAFTCKPYLSSIRLDNNLLTEVAVNQILQDVRDNVNEYKSAAGTLNLGGTGNAAPSGDGVTAKAELLDAIAQLGAAGNWTVTTN